MKLPQNFKLYDTKDYFYWYCIQGNVPESTFWNMPIPFVEGILMNDLTFQNWMDSKLEEERNRNGI